jgi:6-phosphogluconate dehydrogenase
VKLAMIGLGRMGGNMVQRLMQGGHQCVVYDRSADAVKALTDRGAIGAESMQDLAAKLESPRIVWLMVPSGNPTEEAIDELATHLHQGDIIIDGGNSYFKDAIRRAAALAKKKIHFMDVGTSGGVWGLERGYCLMIGGDPAVVEHLTPIFKTLAPGRGSIPRTPGREDVQHSTAEEGFLHCGPAGAGHFVKMVHNGIEYGMMQAMAEGFDLFRSVGKEEVPEDFRYDLNLGEIAEVWRRGSVVTSWLLDLTAQALLEDPKLDDYSGFVQDSGEGRWTVQTAVETAVPADVLTAALYRRFRSRQQATFADKVLSAMRQKFGGHKEPEKKN